MWLKFKDELSPLESENMPVSISGSLGSSVLEGKNRLIMKLQEYRKCPTKGRRPVEVLGWFDTQPTC